MIINSLRFNSK